MAEIQRLVRNYTDFKYLTYKFSTMEEYLIQISKVYQQKSYKFPYYNSDFLPYELESIRSGFLAKNTEQYGNVTDLYSSNSFIRQEIRNLFHQYNVLSSIFSINHLTKRLNDKKSTNKPTKYGELLKIKQDTARMFSHDVINDNIKNSKFFIDYNSTIYSTKEAIESLLVNKTLNTLEIKFKKETSSLPDIGDNQHLHYFLDGTISKELYPVVIFNPSMQERTEVVNLTIEALQAAVFDENLDSVSSQIIPYSTFDFFSRNSRILKDNFTRFLYFEVSLEPMETKIYFVRNIYDEADCSEEHKKYCSKISKEIDLKDNRDADMFNEKFKVSLNEIYLPRLIQNYEKMEDGFELVINLYQYSPNFDGKPQTFNDLTDPQKIKIKLFKALMHKGDLLTQVQIFGSIDSSKYQKDSDQIELLVSLAKGSKFPVISAKMKLNNPRMIAMRVEVPTMIGSSTKVYFGDSMFFTERKFKNEYSVYPAVDGIAVSKGKDIFWFKNSHTLG
jgi:predicted nucleotidyltransferase